jgi:RND family efflux transporter MFP subunit
MNQTLWKFCTVMVAIVMTSGVSTQVAAQNVSYSSDDAVLKVIEEREVPCLTSGVILKNDIKEGSLVKSGQLLMQIDSRMASLDLQKIQKEKQISEKEASSTVELQYARASIEVAQAELSRALRANQRRPGAIANSEIDQLNLMVQRALSEREKTEFQIDLKRMVTGVRNVELAIVEKRIKDHQITAPMDGMVVEILKRQGEWVEVSQPVAKVIQMDKLRAEVKVPASLALDNLVGSKATFKPKLKSLSEKEFSAKVVFVFPEANPVNALVRVWVEIENPDLKLVPGLMGRLEILRENTDVVGDTSETKSAKAETSDGNDDSGDATDVSSGEVTKKE